MAVELADWSLVVSLREQSEALKARAEALSQERIDVLKQAWALDREIEEMTNGRPAPPQIQLADDASLMERIPPLIEGLGPTTSTQVAEHLNVSGLRARHALQRLVQLQVLKSSGIGRGTLYGLASDEDLIASDPGASAYTLVRDAAIRLGEFEFEALDSALPMLSSSSIRKVLPKLVTEGKLAAERHGHRKRWRYLKPEGPTAPRPRSERPELTAVKHAPPERRTQAPSQRARGLSGVPSDVRKLLADVQRAGGGFRRRDSSHIAIFTGRKGDRPYALGLPMRDEGKTRSRLRAKGLDV